MGRRGRRQRLPAEPVEARIADLSHDGRGVARGPDGKTVFIDGALPGETVRFVYTSRRRSHDEGYVADVLEASPERVEPRCAHFGVCGGCALQHLAPEHQIAAKENVLRENFRRLGDVEPAEWFAPLTGPFWGYRGKARLGVKYVEKKGRLLVGFREKRKPYVAEIDRCEVLHASVGTRLEEIAAAVSELDARKRIPQIEVAVAEEGTALVLRHLDELSAADAERLHAFAARSGYLLYLQPGGPDTVRPFHPETIGLSYRIPAFDATLRFEPTDFTQVNLSINQAMVERALELIDAQPDDRILDLFCGLGNFTIPLARKAGEVVGVEGERGLVERARNNAKLNSCTNAAFHVADLAADDVEDAPWWRQGFDKVLLDPPRSGAREVLGRLAHLKPERIVYVSCNPSTLARDAGILVHEHGFTLAGAGVMDMFPHTAHVESIALFTRKR